MAGEDRARFRNRISFLLYLAATLRTSFKLGQGQKAGLRGATQP